MINKEHKVESTVRNMLKNKTKIDLINQILDNECFDVAAVRPNSLEMHLINGKMDILKQQSELLRTLVNYFGY